MINLVNIIRFILRNHLAQDSIDFADNEQFTEAKIFLKLLENPFSEDSLESILEEFNSTHSKCKYK